MNSRLVVVLNGASQLEYDRTRTLPEAQQEALTRMDERMSGGIEVDGQWVTDPDALQRARFVAGQLMQALNAGNEQLAAATCTYLAERIPELQQVRIDNSDQGMHFDLVFDKPFMKETPLEFFKPTPQDA